MNHVGAQNQPDTAVVSKKITLLLPDGRILPMEKFDSLEQVWGKGRVMFRHNEEDDAKGIMHLVRVTNEMKQAQDAEKERKKHALDSLLNKPAPAFALTDMGGMEWALEKQRGKIVVLNFWFTSCLPCIKEIPELNKLVKKYSGKEIVFFALTFDNADQVSKFLKKYVFEFILLPSSNEIDKKYHISSWPASMVIDQHGHIKSIIQSSPAITEELEVVIDDLRSKDKRDQ